MFFGGVLGCNCPETHRSVVVAAKGVRSKYLSVKDDILGSLDGIMWLPDLGWLVCETKLRFTLNGEIPLSHLQQVRAYCHLAETDRVCYVSGHITSTPPTAQTRMRIFRLTEQSIQETWQGVCRTRDYLAGQGCCPEGVQVG